MTSCGVDPRCAKCRLRESRTKVVPGSGPCPASMMIIGEAPGKDEDFAGSPFVGRAGRILDQALADAGISRNEIYITNIVKCRPPKNRRPRADELSACAKYLENELRAVKPSVVCLLGATVARSLAGDFDKMGDIAGTRTMIAVGGLSVTAFVAYHPAACLYKRELLESLTETLSAACGIAGGSSG